MNVPAVAGRAEQVVGRADHVLDEVLDRPLGARRRAAQLVGPDPGQHPGRLRGGPLEERHRSGVIKHVCN
jgi:hypothetical protein